MSAVAKLPVSNAACERSFSKMNSVFTTAQHAYYCTHVIFVVCVDGRSPSGRMESASYAKTWIAKVRQHANYIACPERLVGNDATDAAKALWNVFD